MSYLFGGEIKMHIRILTFRIGYSQESVRKEALESIQVFKSRLTIGPLFKTTLPTIDSPQNS